MIEKISIFGNLSIEFPKEWNHVSLENNLRKGIRAHGVKPLTGMPTSHNRVQSLVLATPLLFSLLLFFFTSNLSLLLYSKYFMCINSFKFYVRIITNFTVVQILKLKLKVIKLVIVRLFSNSDNFVPWPVLLIITKSRKKI